MSRSKLSFKVVTDSDDLVLKVALDGQAIWQSTPGQTHHLVVHEFDDDLAGDHLLEISMQGKLASHTVLDQTGSIISDCVATLSDFSLDDVDLGQTLYELARYHHDHNGSSAPVIDRFYGVMGCNGKMQFEFSSPVWMWLLQHM